MTGGVDEVLAQRWGDDGDALVAAALAAKEAAMDRAAADLAARNRLRSTLWTQHSRCRARSSAPKGIRGGDPADVARDKTTNNVDASSVVTIDVVTPEIVTFSLLEGRQKVAIRYECKGFSGPVTLRLVHTFGGYLGELGEGDGIGGGRSKHRRPRGTRDGGRAARVCRRRVERRRARARGCGQLMG